MTHFTPLPALLGGLLIGVAASALLVASGRGAGISGVLGAIVDGRRAATEGRAWRLLFVAGLLVGGVLVAIVAPGAFQATVPRSTPLLVAAGLLVGVGTRVGGGCTSGHGLLGL